MLIHVSKRVSQINSHSGHSLGHVLKLEENLKLNKILIHADIKINMH